MPAAPFKVKAVYDYHSEEPDDLTFPTGQIITVTDDADEDWYTGEYNSASGEKLEGIFPRNFVEKYEPAIPTRPNRAPKRTPAPAPEPVPEPAQEPEEPAQVQAAKLDADPEPEPEPSKPVSQPVAPPDEPVAPKATEPPAPAPAAAQKPASSKPGPPPVADKPSSNSFKDRIAAFNKPAAAPVAPFKPGGNTSSGFIKKPFVAPPPSKNSYVPPPREPPPQKIYRREEEQEEERSVPPPPPQRSEEPDEDDQPKPTSLKERIALLQKQQLEQAQRHADASQKKEKPKKPPKKRVDPVDEPEVAPAEANLEKADTNETVGRASSDLTREPEAERPQVHRQDSATSGPTPQPARELVSDTNDADDSGAGDTEDAPGTSTEEERPRSKGTATAGHVEPKRDGAVVADEGEDEDSGEEEEEEEDPEVKRRRELRERMSKLGGGVGMMGMFGPPGGVAPPPVRKSRPSQEHSRASEEQAQAEAARAPPVPIMALPGMSNQLPRRPTEPAEEDSDEEANTAQPTPLETPKQADVEDDYISQPPPPPRRSETSRSSASIDRHAPPPPQRENRAPPPPPPETRAVPPPPPSGRSVPPPPLATNHAEGEDIHVASPASTHSRRSEEHPMSPSGAPPVPGSRPRPDPVRKPSQDPSMTSPVTSPVTRAPPPPPPAGPPSRRTTTNLSNSRAQDDGSDEEVTEYDGDYDTDIASSAKHKDALKAHNRDSSFDDGVLTDDATKSPKSPPTRSVPPLPPLPNQHAAPPPPPQVAPSRKSTDVPRAAPPPIPPPAMPQVDNDEYDPYRYNPPSHGLPTPQLNDIYSMPPGEEREEDDMYGASHPPPPPADRSAPPPPPADRSAPPPPPTERVAPPPPPAERSAPMPPTSPPTEPPAAPPKQSTDIRRSLTTSRRSMEQPRASGDGFMAHDIDLGHSSFWWTQPRLPPPSLANRSDLIFEMEESNSSNRSGRPVVSKDVYVLYNDYSRTIVNATFDQADPSQVTFEQHHERPPPPARKDQLEMASEKFGASIGSAASGFGNQGATVGDGSAQGFISELFRPLPNALRPVGTRAYGALVYANLANASTQQHDEIRAGDIISFRNAKFSGHTGTLKHKYTLEAGKPDHVAVVADWDGTKKKVRAWEQRSEDDRKEKKRAKVREESYRMGDLKSGEVRVWRVMGREYVGWDKS